MAQKTVVILSDDIDGSEASEIINFALDGSEYEIDLNNDHANEPRKALERERPLAAAVVLPAVNPAVPP